MEIYLDDFQKETLYDLQEDLIYIEDIDQVAFGKVIHAKEKKTNKDISVKIIDKRQADQSLIKKMKEEISILKKLDHENIVKFYGHSAAVQVSGRLIGKEDGRLVGQGAGYGHALLLAAGEFGRFVGKTGFQAYESQEFFGP